MITTNMYSSKIKYVLMLVAIFNFYNIEAQSLESIAQQRIIELNALISTAENSGKQALKEKLTVRTAEVFLEYANWDAANIKTNTENFAAGWHYKDNASQMANLLPDFERQDIIKMLDSSLVQLARIINGTVVRKPIPTINWGNVTHNGDQLWHNENPVFLADWSWKPETNLLQEYHGQLDGHFITLNYVTDDSGTIKANKLSELNNKPSGKSGFIFMNNRGVPQWAIDKYGADFVIKDEKNVRYTEYDIDHPGAKEMMSLLVKGLVPQMAGKNYSNLGYMMCNEPHFINTVEANGNLSWASSGVSNYTIETFKVWLKNKHTTISNLNTLWGTNFANFDAVSIAIPISVTLQGTAKWYDWMSFNMDRVTNWYQFMKDEILASDANAKVHLKIIPKHWTDNGRTTGLDVEALTRMSGIIGNDAGSVFRSAPWKTEEWESKYVFEWSEMSMAHDFFKSISPNKIIFNTEAHFLSTKASIDLYLDPMHSRAAYWLAHTQGLNASQTWYWSRREDGSARNANDVGYAGSNNHQPRVVNEVHAPLMDLNAHSDDITKFQRQRKPIRIFYTKASSVNKRDHMDDIFELYESLSFEGVPLGFVTKDILLNENPSDWDVVLVHETEFVTQADKDVLQAYIDAGGKVIMDTVSFTKDEYGRNMNALTGGITKISGIENMKTAALSVVDGFGNMPKVEFSETSTVNYNHCLWKVVENSEGNQIMSIINVGKVNTEINISLKNPTIGTVVKDLLKGVQIENTKTLKPYELLFVELIDTNKLGLKDVKDNSEIQLFPNPSTGKVNLFFPKTAHNVSINVTSLEGKNIYKSEYNNIQKLNLDLSFMASGLYMIKVASELQNNAFKFIKI
jgi:beta-galactosidase